MIAYWSKKLTWIDQPLNPPFTHGRDFVNADGKEVGSLGRIFAVKVSGGNGFTAIGKNDLKNST
jgi:hypothetical protein